GGRSPPNATAGRSSDRRSTVYEPRWRPLRRPAWARCPADHAWELPRNSARGGARRTPPPRPASSSSRSRTSPPIPSSTALPPPTSCRAVRRPIGPPIDSLLRLNGDRQSTGHRPWDRTRTRIDDEPLGVERETHETRDRRDRDRQDRPPVPRPEGRRRQPEDQ